MDAEGDAADEIDRLRSLVARVGALPPKWFAEPANCTEPRFRNDAEGCGASSVFATELKDAIEGSTEWRDGPKRAALSDEAK